MNTMNMPGFTAEAYLYKTRKTARIPASSLGQMRRSSPRPGRSRRLTMPQFTAEASLYGSTPRRPKNLHETFH